ncbi:MAG: Lrp/AsnC family transcriptional regulator [Rhodospirillales bacterium]|jgi:siroheme decarboxylase|nr:Lrp/AsnC family transcriptional regulator [Rhodospirillales bacterium]
MQLTIDNTDKQIILATQAGLELSPDPYNKVAKQLGLSTDDVLRRMENMLKSGVIRRIGVVPNHYALGYRSNGMTVWDVSDDQVSTLGEKIGNLPFVSHCYERPRHLPDWTYNLFAMVHAKTREGVEQQADEIKTILGDNCRADEILYSTRILKKTGLRFATSSSQNSNQD